MLDTGCHNTPGALVGKVGATWLSSLSVVREFDDPKLIAIKDSMKKP